jgi:peroxiredoxin
MPILFASCKKEHNKNDFAAYFGGEITHPTSPYVIFCKDSEPIDTIVLNKDNTFFKKFDSLTPGLYSFKHEPEYQYVYFEKNDSLMVTINSKDFDQSIVFSGRGDDKNNFLMQLYLKNEADRSKMFSILDYGFKEFSKNIDSSFQSKSEFYQQKKEQIKWSNDFDLYAKATLNFLHYSKKEVYPIVHKIRTGEDVREKLPKDYYQFRTLIDFNNNKFTNFSPFVKYLTNMLNNITMHKTGLGEHEIGTSLELNIEKLNVADTLFKNKKVKNIILNNIAFAYLLEDQNISNIQNFLIRFNEVSTDKSKQNEILKIGNAIQSLKVGNALPNIKLIDINSNSIEIKSILDKKAVIFFWTDCLNSHMIAAHKKVIELEKRHKNYRFIAINVDESQEKWASDIKTSNFNNIQEYRCTNFDELKEKWVINKIHRTIITDENGTINNAFVSLFDVNFEKLLK